MSHSIVERADAARTWLCDHALPLWWERGFDASAGCYHEALNLDGTPARQPKRVRVQARQTIVYARARWLGWDGPWRAAVEAGVNVLLRRVIRPDGGTRHLLATSGEPLDDRRDLYDLAFVLLALSEAARALDGRKDLMAAAENLLSWLETHWAHPGGGFREGDVNATPPRRQNPHMHLFEALLSLYEATRDPAHLQRASALGVLFRDKLFDRTRGVVPEEFDDVWRPVPDARVEPGHMFEWSWLLHRWRTLGGAGAGDIAETLRANAETSGVDAGGVLLASIPADGETARLWQHTERLKAHLARIETSDDPGAVDAALRAHDALVSYLETPTPGLWRDRRGAGGAFVEEPAPASTFYHIVFAFDELIRVAKLRG